MQLRETLNRKYQIKLNEIELQEPVGSGKKTIHSSLF